MSTSTTASQQYLKGTVMTAKPEQLQVMLLDGAVRYASKGREALAARQFEESFNHLDRAQRICLQLGAGLNREANPELADQMAALYNFCYMRLVEANMQREPQLADEAIRILKHQRETWQLIVERLAKEGAAVPAAGSVPGPQGGSAKVVQPQGAPQRRNPLVAAPEEETSSINFEG